MGHQTAHYLKYLNMRSPLSIKLQKDRPKLPTAKKTKTDSPGSAAVAPEAPTLNEEQI